MCGADMPARREWMPHVDLLCLTWGLTMSAFCVWYDSVLRGPRYRDALRGSVMWGMLSDTWGMLLPGIGPEPPSASHAAPPR
eukprot:1522257-Rhodomonas_salina.1